MTDETRRIALDRRVLVVRPERIDLRPERGAVLFPLIVLLLSFGLFDIVATFASALSVTVLALLLIPGLLLAPFSGMGLVYSVIGASVVIEKENQSIRFHQGVMGLGIGTIELVPFWKVDRIIVEDFSLGEVAPGVLPPPLDLRAWDIVLLKVSGKRISIAQVMSANAPDLLDEAFNRTLDAAEAIADMAGSSVEITAAVEDDERAGEAVVSGMEAESSIPDTAKQAAG
jgi:hypothetical protein